MDDEAAFIARLLPYFDDEYEDRVAGAEREISGTVETPEEVRARGWLYNEWFIGEGRSWEIDFVDYLIQWGSFETFAEQA